MLKPLFAVLAVASMPWCASADARALANGPKPAADPAQLLKRADAARGGGLPGLSWRLAVHAVYGDKVDEQGLTVKTDGNSNLAEFFAPANIADQKLLMVGRNMWFIRNGLRKPVPISPRQRLLGQAANGDIAATNYAVDYEAKVVGEEVVAGEPCYKLELTARNDEVSYPRIDYWVSLARGDAVQADYLAASGKVFKRASFEYKNRIDFKGKSIPFVSRMVIEDRINPAQKTTLDYTQVKAVELPRRTFDLNFLVQ